MSNIWTNPDVGRRYLDILLEEKKILAFYVHGLPSCNNLLNQEIARVSEIISNQGFNILDGLQTGSPNLSGALNMMPDAATQNLGHLDVNSGWHLFQHKGLFDRTQGPPINNRNVLAPNPCTFVTKKFLRVDIPVNRYPNFNFVGRLLGPRGNSLKRIAAYTGCRFFIRGRGSMKDFNKEERLRGSQGYEHLNEPLHVLIEAESPVNEIDAQLRKAHEIIIDVLKPVRKDLYKREQLAELNMLNSRFKEDISQASSSASPCRSGDMKRATTARK